MAVNNENIKRVCMISTHGYFDPIPELGKTDTGGQVVYVLELARSLSQLGVKVDIYTRWFDKKDKQINPLPNCPDVRVIRIPAGEWEFIPKEQIYDILPELVENMTAFITEQGLQYEVFHGHYVDAGIVGLEVAQAFSKPFIFTAHSLGAWKRSQMTGNPEELDKIFNFKHRVAEELRVFEAVNALAITSFDEKDNIKQLYNHTPNDIEFIPPGVDVHLFRPLNKGEKETSIDLPDNYIFVVGRLAEVKGHDLLLPAFVEVLKEFPDVHLVIGGGSKDPDDEEKQVLENTYKFIEDNNISNRVHLTGGLPHDELPHYYRQSKLFILAAKYEPFGMTALEAMACQVPVVVTKFSGIHENLIPEKNCMTMDPFKTEEYSEAICSLLRDESFANNVAEQGYYAVKQEFSWEAIAKKTLAFYKRIVDES